MKIFRNSAVSIGILIIMIITIILLPVLIAIAIGWFTYGIIYVSVKSHYEDDRNDNNSRQDESEID